ncbi:hypothetical protein JZU46_01735 [bacterium]|nr:hypothetical protein [bacterium]
MKMLTWRLGINHRSGRRRSVRTVDNMSGIVPVTHENTPVRIHPLVTILQGLVNLTMEKKSSDTSRKPPFVSVIPARKYPWSLMMRSDTTKTCPTTAEPASRAFSFSRWRAGDVALIVIPASGMRSQSF